MIAHRLRRELEAGRAARDIVVLVRATASLRLFEEALEEQGVPTYVVGGRGYWSQQPVRDGLAYLAALANPLDEEALLGVLASPFCGVGSDALILLAGAGKASDSGDEASGRGSGGVARCGRRRCARPARSRSLPAGERERLLEFAAFFAAERAHAERLPVEVLLERALETTGYDLAVLARSGGERRLANLRKLMRLAREYERAEGRDLHGFLAYAATRDLAAAREGEAPLESEGLDAVRLMTIHRAKGLEFPVVCVADLGRQGGGRQDRLLLGADGSVGLRLATPGSGGTVPALAFERLAADAAAAEDAEERRLFYVAMTRACDRLILSGTADPERRTDAAPGRAAAGLDRPRAGLLGGLTGAPRSEERVVHGAWDGRPARVLSRLDHARDDRARGAAGRAAQARRDARHRAARAPEGDARAVDRAARRRSGSATPRSASTPAAPTASTSSGRCACRRSGRPASARHAADAADEAPALDPRVRGVIAHRLLEDLDFARPAAAGPRRRASRSPPSRAPSSAEEDVEDIRAIVAAFGASPLCARIAAAASVRREADVLVPARPRGRRARHRRRRRARPRCRRRRARRRLQERPPRRARARTRSSRATTRPSGSSTRSPRCATARPSVEVAYAFLERPDAPVSETFSPRDVPALAERLTQLAEGVLEGRHPVAAEPHRGLCGDCPGRATLCSWPESMTLRELGAGSRRRPGPSRAAAGRRSGATARASGGCRRPR